jgi:trans-2,3-dihydro-3-hydroxyanthranilate isomerase
MTRDLDFLWLDVFTGRAFAGNSLCVFPDGEGLSPAQMQALARETNLSETTFVLPPSIRGATYRVRIFTPHSELPFAGHPTLGTASALHFADRITEADVMQESDAGLTRIHLERLGERTIRATMHAPMPRFAGAVDPARVAAALRVPQTALDPGSGPEIIEAGLRHLIVRLVSVDVLGRLQPEAGLLAALAGECGTTGVYPFALHPSGSPAFARARLFAPHIGVGEDPATGSAVAPLGLYLHRHGLLAADGAFAYEQGIEIGRPSILHARVAVGAGGVVTVQVAGEVCLVGEGRFRAPT